MEEKKQLWTLKHETGRGNRQFIMQPNVVYIIHENHKQTVTAILKETEQVPLWVRARSEHGRYDSEV